MNLHNQTYTKYIIPFSFNKNDYKNILISYINDDWKESEIDQCNEFFGFVKGLLSSNLESSIGLVLKKEYSNIFLCNTNFKEELELIKSEIYIFKTGLGFFCYQVNYPEGTKFDVLIDRNNDLKSYAKNKEVIKQLTMKKMILEDKYLDDNGTEYICYGGKNNTVKINESLIPKLDVGSEIKVYKNDSKLNVNSIMISYKEVEFFDYREYFLDILAPFGKIEFFINEFKTSNGKKMISKSNIFSSVLLDENIEDQLIQQCVKLSKGYTNSYLSTDITAHYHALKLYDNVCWSVAREGMANVVNLTGDHAADKFFETNYKERLENYFILYIFALQQYYNLIKVARHIGELSSDLNIYLESEHEYSKLKSLYEEIDFIYLKCIYHEITHISHQAQIYKRTREILGIDILVAEVNFEMDRLKASVDEIREHKTLKTREEEQRSKEVKAKYFSIIGGVFAFFSIFNTIWGIVEDTGIIQWAIFRNLGHRVVIHFIAVILIMTLGFVTGTFLYQLWKRYLLNR